MKTGFIPAVQVVWDDRIGRIKWCGVVSGGVRVGVGKYALVQVV
jgi:hypothetical protein